MLASSPDWGVCVLSIHSNNPKPHHHPQALARYGAPEEDDALFLRLQDRLVKDYSNDLLSQPYQLAMAETNVLLVAPYSTRVRGVLVCHVSCRFIHKLRRVYACVHPYTPQRRRRRQP